MNLESSLRDLDGELRATEAPLGTTAAGVRRQARAVRRRRRSVVAVSACVVAVAGIVIAPWLLRSSDADNAPVAGEDAAMLAPDDLAEVIRQFGHELTPTGRERAAVTVVALDAQGNVIERADRDKASAWEGEFDYGPDHRVSLELARDSMLSFGNEQVSCAAAVDTGWAVSCDVDELSDGSIVRAETRGVIEVDGVWEGVRPDRFDAESELWMQRMVRHQTSDGDATMVTALTRAHTIDELSIDEFVTDEELHAIAADPRLRFPVPPQTADGCDWVVNDLRSSHWCVEEFVEAPEPPGGEVRVTVDPAAPVDADLEELARSFVDYALGETDAFPVGETVAFALGGELAKHVDDIAAALPNRGIWQFCPDGWEIYGASACPVDTLDVLRVSQVSGTELVISASPGAVTCAPERTGPLPHGRLVVIRPEERRQSCASDFSLVLAADAQGRLTAIDLTRADP